MDTPYKFSRATAAALAAAAHLCLVYLLITHASTRAEPRGPFVKPIEVSLIERPLRPPVPLAQITLNPTLAKIKVRLPQEPPDYPIELPAEPTPSEGSSTPVGGSSGIGGSVNQAPGGPLALTVIHYVAPRYPDLAARFHEHGEVAMALLVDAHGNVDQVKIVGSSGFSRLDRAAVSAVRQWRFAPVESAVPVWGQVKLLFAPPQRVLGVPFIVMPYAAVAPKIDAEIGTNRKRSVHAPSAEVSVRRSLEKLIAAFPAARGNDSESSASQSIEAEVGLLGGIHSVRFLGFVDHGIALDRSNSWEAQGPPQPQNTHWEVYDVEQDRGSSVWLVEAAASGSIQRIEVAVR
jgi:TonB family protein